MEKTEYQEEKHAQSMYSSKRRIQRHVLNLEQHLAKAIYNFSQNSGNTDLLQSILAFLSSWKFSKVGFGKSAFWCDAIYFDMVQIENNKNFVFQGHAWIGLVSNVDKEWKVAVSGHFTINASGKRLKRYTLKFYDNDQLIVLSK